MQKTQAIAKISSYCLTQQKDEFRSIILIFNPLDMLLLPLSVFISLHLFYFAVTSV